MIIESELKKIKKCEKCWYSQNAGEKYCHIFESRPKTLKNVCGLFVEVKTEDIKFKEV